MKVAVRAERTQPVATRPTTHLGQRLDSTEIITAIDC